MVIPSRLVAGLCLLLVALAGCGESQAVMPDVTGQSLDVAMNEITASGVEEDVNVEGGGVLGVIDESNWVVCAQVPAAGQAVTGAPTLRVDRSCAGVATGTSADASTAPGEGDATEPSNSENAATLTAENSSDLAALLVLKDECDEKVSQFATEYEGRTIKFDGSVLDLANHDSYKTRYDILIGAGDYSTTTQIGPSFKYRDVNFPDLNFTGSERPDSVSTGDNLTFTAEVGEYLQETCLFLLSPVSTSSR